LLESRTAGRPLNEQTKQNTFVSAGRSGRGTGGKTTIIKGPPARTILLNSVTGKNRAGKLGIPLKDVDKRD